MATNFPTTLDTSTTLPVEGAAIPLSTNHVTAHQNIQDALEAVEAKVGVNSSAVTTSHDYKLSGVTGTDKAVSLTGSEALTNKTLTAPTITSPKVTVGSDAVGDLHYTSNVDGTLSRLAKGTDNQILKMNGTALNWEAETTTVNADQTTAGIVEEATAAEITSGTATGGSGASLYVSPDQLALSRPVTEVQTFSTAGTTSWTKGNNAKWVEVTVIGGGGGGGANSTASATGGGGGGGYSFKRFSASALGSSETVVVGAGGTAGSGSDGGGGGYSSFGTSVLLKSSGGSGGSASAGTGGSGNGDIKYTGGAGGINSANGVDTAVDPSPRGGGGGGYNGGTPANAAAGGNGGSFITNYVKAGGAGGAGGVNNGTSASATNTGLIYGGVGGGGGGYNGNGTNTGGNGGAGNLGSGGGGANGTGTTGGVGGDGMVVVVTYF